MRLTKNHDDAAGLIRRRAAQATTAFELAKAKFTAAFATNPKYAIEWHAEGLAKAQTYHDWWRAVVEVLDRRGVEAAIAYAAERLNTEMASRCGSDGFCPWKNALRLCEVVVYDTASRDVQDIRDAAAKTFQPATTGGQAHA